MHIGQITIELFIGLLALLAATRILGKTQIDQLTPFDFISALVLGDLVGSAVYDSDVKIWSILYAITLWTILILRGTRNILEGNPSIIIRDGHIDRQQLSANNLDINELQQMLRQRYEKLSMPY